MKKVIDVCGLSCPEPLLRLKEVIDGADEIELRTDSQGSVENCSRFARSNGFQVSINGNAKPYVLLLTKK